MLLRYRRVLFRHCHILIPGMCLALTAGVTGLPSAWPEDGTPSLTPSGHDLPLTALMGNPGVRNEKQAQAQRLSIKRPERAARLSLVTVVANPRPSIPSWQIYRSLPRRLLPAVHIESNSPDEPSDPFLS